MATKSTTKAAKGQTTTAAKKARKAAKGAAPNPRHVAQLVGANRGHDVLAILNDGSKHKVTNWALREGEDFDAAKMRELARLRAEQEAKTGAALPQLARGVDARTNPNSAKSVRDAHAAAKATKPAKAAKAERKAARAAKAAPKADDPRRIKVIDKKFTFGGEGTARRTSWDACRASKTVAEYLKAGGKAKYLPRWVASGAIQLVG